MEIRRTLGGLAVLFVMLAACGTTTPAPQETPTPSETPTATWHTNAMGTPVPPARTPLPTPTRGPTDTPDLIASATGQAIATESHLTQVAHDAEYRATVAVIQATWAPFGSCYLDLDLDFISPNGEWALCDPITLADRNGNHYHLTFADMSRPPFSGEWFIGYHHWTQDGQYLYMAPIIMADGGYNPWALNGFMLVRLSLQAGQVQESVIVPYSSACENCLPTSQAFSVSPTDRRLAYFNFHHLDALILRDLRNDTETAIPIDPGYNQAGWFAWSQDGLSLVYYLVNSDEMDCHWTESIRWLDVQSGATIRVVDNVPVNWCDDNYHIANDYDVIEVTASAIRFERDGTYWTYDLATRQMTQQPGP